jgi:hypothetical protein
LAARITIPNVRYRLDIGNCLTEGDFLRMEGLGMLANLSAGAASRGSLRAPNME